jgi:hypothetical protein
MKWLGTDPIWNHGLKHENAVRWLWCNFFGHGFAGIHHTLFVSVAEDSNSMGCVAFISFLIKISHTICPVQLLCRMRSAFYVYAYYGMTAFLQLRAEIL